MTPRMRAGRRAIVSQGERLLSPRAFHHGRAASSIVSPHHSCHCISTGVFPPVALFPTTLPSVSVSIVVLSRHPQTQNQPLARPPSGASFSGPLQLLHPWTAPDNSALLYLPHRASISPRSNTLRPSSTSDVLSTSQLLLVHGLTLPSHILYSLLCLHRNPLALAPFFRRF
ncbi:hypothetical protein BGZ60DRAFT_132548 [Tricladium varicosporioides]|nr:hypothetical protein BGZ60DRAFT_132548 [Hymenoscyphus varicosporioides]